MEKQTHQGQRQSWCGFPCSLFDCRDYTGRWKIREDCLKWLADLFKEWPQVLTELIQRGGQMHLLSYIGLIRLINQSHPHPPIRFRLGYFYETGYRRSAKFFWSLTNGGLTCTWREGPTVNSAQVNAGDCFVLEKNIFWGCCWKTFSLKMCSFYKTSRC